MNWNQDWCYLLYIQVEKHQNKSRHIWVWDEFHTFGLSSELLLMGYFQIYLHHNMKIRSEESLQQGMWHGCTYLSSIHLSNKYLLIYCFQPRCLFTHLFNKWIHIFIPQRYSKLWTRYTVLENARDTHMNKTSPSTLRNSESNKHNRHVHNCLLVKKIYN